jgi:hypothetical protein
MLSLLPVKAMRKVVLAVLVGAGSGILMAARDAVSGVSLKILLGGAAFALPVYCGLRMRGKKDAD